MSSKDDALADEIIVRQLNLFRFTNSERMRVLALLRNMEEELVHLLTNNGDQLTDIGREDKARLLRQAQAVIDDYYTQTADSTGQHLGELAQLEAKTFATSLESALQGAITPSLPTAEVMRKLVDNTLIQGAPSADWWARQSGDLQFRFKNAVAQGLAQSETNDQIIRRIRGKYVGYQMVDGERVNQYAGGVLDATRANAAALVQTSVQAAANGARRETMLANLDVISGIRQVSTLDGHTTPVCIAYSQAAWKLPGYQPIAPNTLPYNAGVPRHWNCLPGDSLVTTRGDVTGVSKRWIDANVVVIKTASGREFTSTPNHPVLTPGGWVAAGLLNVGGHVIADGGSEWGGIGNGNSKDVPTPIHEFTEAWLNARKVLAEPVPLTAKDFHGDGVDSQVAVVYSDRLLRDRLDAARAKHVSQLGFVSRLAARAVRLIRGRHREQALGEGWAAPRGGIGSQGKALAFLGRGAGHARRLLFAAVARADASVAKHALDQWRRTAADGRHAGDTDSSLEQRERGLERHVAPHAFVALDADRLQAAPDRVLPDVEKVRELLNGFTGRMFADEIVEVQVKAFHGYVYNLETSGGWYSANGIVTHNCRSVEIPITKTFKELGIDLPEFNPSTTTRSATGGPVAADMSFGAFLKRQEQKGPAFVDDLLGPGRAQLWRDGKITLRQLVDQNGAPLSLAELRKRYGG